MFGVVNQMWSVRAMLCNFQNNIISEKLLNPYIPRIKPCVTSQTLADGDSPVMEVTELGVLHPWY